MAKVHAYEIECKCGKTKLVKPGFGRRTEDGWSCSSGRGGGGWKCPDCRRIACNYADCGETHAAPTQDELAAHVTADGWRKSVIGGKSGWVCPGCRATKKQRRGFASMSPEKQKLIAAKGGAAAHAKGTAHEWTTEEARSAGRKGGVISRGGRGKLAQVA